MLFDKFRSLLERSRGVLRGQVSRIHRPAAAVDHGQQDLFRLGRP